MVGFKKSKMRLKKKIKFLQKVGSLPQQLLVLHLLDNQTSQGTEKGLGNLEQS